MKYGLLATIAGAIGIASLVRLANDNANACAPINNTVTTLYNSDVVFMGKLIEINWPDYTFENLKERTGTAQPTYTVTIDIASSANPCGKQINPQSGEVYIIYQSIIDAFEGIMALSGTTAFDQRLKDLNDDKDRYCSALYSPVCGVDGKTYLNSCRVELAERDNKRDIDVGYTGECVLFCRYQDPFCGNDRKTYANKCTADIVNMTGNFGVCDNRTTTQKTNNTKSSCQQLVQYCYEGSTILVRACDADVGKIPPLSKAGVCNPLITSSWTNNSAPISIGTQCTAPTAYCLNNQTNYYDTVCNIAPSNATKWACTNANTNITIENVSTASQQTVIQRLFDNGLTMRPTVDTFRGEADITREQAAKFFGEYARSVMKKTPNTSKTCEFSDINTANPWLKDSIILSCQLDLFAGSNGKFYPLAPLTNAEAITVMMKMAQWALPESNPRYKVYRDKAQSENLTTNLSNISDYNKINRNASRINVWTLMFRYSN